MKRLVGVAIFFLLGLHLAIAQKVDSSNILTRMELSGAPVKTKNLNVNVSLETLQALNNGPASKLLAKIAQTPLGETAGVSRSAKDAQIYRTVSPSVVLIVTKDGLGSGSLLSAAGDIITNFHVIKGYSTVAVIFKPAIEGAKATRDDVRVGQVVKYDEVSDLALLRVTGVPVGRGAIRLGDPGEISIGADVHAIGHPTGEAWTYTKGVISQFRMGYEWQSEGETTKHKADIIQTQTPINPGNSGGPLISDAGNLIGINSFKAAGEGLNFAVSVDEAKKFLARSNNRVAQHRVVAKQSDCKPKELSRFRNKENNATVVSIDMFCTGRVTAEHVTPDDPLKAVYLRMDRNQDGKADVIFFDLKRRGKWDMSWWDEDFNGQWTLVGYHDDGSATPTRFESFAAYQHRIATR